MISPLKELLFPVHCFGCKQLGIEICSQCRRYWNPHFYIQKLEGLSVYSSIRYSSVAKSILLSAKEDSIKIADELIISALTNCIKRLPTQVLRKSILVPIPGSKRAIRKRGRDFIYELTKEVSLRTGLPCISGMEVTRTLLDQSGLSAIDRRRNIAGAFKTSIQSSEQELILVDDLVTTGATLLEAKRALFTNGITVSRAITACVAQAPTIRG